MLLLQIIKIFFLHNSANGQAEFLLPGIILIPIPSISLNQKLPESSISS